MKQQLRLLMTMLLCAVFGSVAAADVTDVLTKELTGVTGSSYSEWTYDEAASGAVYAGQSAGGNDAIQLRSKSSNSGIVTTTSGGFVKSITVTWNSNTVSGRTLNIYGKNTAYSSPADLYGDNAGDLLGSIKLDENEPTTLEIDGDYAYIGLRSKSDAMYLDKISIVWGSEGTVTPVAPNAPTFDPESGTFYSAQTVTLACSTSGATIYYTLDGADPTTSSTPYSEPIKITETTTIKAIAAKSGLTSEVATATYTIKEPEALTNIAALTALTPSEATEYNVKLDNAVVTYANGKYAYIQDASGAIALFKSDHGLTAGQTLTGTAAVTYQLYNGNPQIIALDGITPADGTAPEPTTVEASAWSTPIATVLSQYFKVTGATITKESSKYYVQLGDEKVQLYGQGNARTISVSDRNVTYTIIGFPTLYTKDGVTTPELQIFEQPTPESTPKVEAGLKYDVNNFTATIGKDNEFPVLSNPNGLTVTYSSSNGEVATVNETGAITLLKAGQTTIKAVSEENENYLAGSASYLLIVEEVAIPGTDVYELVDDPETIAAGDEIIIVNVDNTYALSTTQNDNNRAAAAVSLQSDGTIIPSNQVQVLTIEGDESDWCFNTGSGYLYAPSSGSNHLKTQAKASDDAHALIIIDEEGVATITFLGDHTHNTIRFNPNNNSPIFSCYLEDATTGTAVRVYRNTSGKAAAGLAYSEDEFTATIGEENAFPTLDNPNSLKVTYASSDETVATIDATGNVTLVAAGTTTITATSAETDNFKAGKASYDLTVVKPEVPQQDNSDVFELVTDFSTLAANDEIIFVGEITTTDEEENSTTNYYGLSTEQKPNNRGAVTVTHNADGTITGNNKLQTITLEGEEDDWYFNVGNGYLYAASNEKNYLRTEAEADANASAIISYDEEGKTSIVFQGTNTRRVLQFNALNVDNLLFSCYSSASQSEVKIYRKKAEVTLLMGDANGDGEVSIPDVMLTVGYSKNGSANNFHFENADMNGDGEISVADVMAIVAIILGN